MIIEPFNSGDERTAPAFWTLEREFEVCSAEQLLAKFYDLFDPTDYPISYNPLGQVYNPEREDGQRYYSFSNEQVCVFPFRRGFYVVVEKNWRLIEGPHATKLFYRSHQMGEVIWVATMQSVGMFYNEQTLRDAVMTAIHAHEFFQSDRSKQEIIYL